LLHDRQALPQDTTNIAPAWQPFLPALPIENRESQIGRLFLTIRTWTLPVAEKPYKIPTVKTGLDTDQKSIVLIGMCGVGKSTVGVLLAKALGRRFIDTDVHIQAVEHKTLQQVINELGIDAFCDIEQKHILSITATNAVIATGGSAVYRAEAMQHLADIGIIIHLDLDYGAIEHRVTNLYTRGVVMAPGQTLRTLHQQRQPLYKKYAHLTVDCHDKNHEEIVDEIITHLTTF
jgi:shikimate kinase